MGNYVVRFAASIDLAVTVDAADEDRAAEAAWALAHEYAETIYGTRDIQAAVSLDGIDPYEIEPVD